jgi:aromatic ring hydroxylase
MAARNGQEFVEGLRRAPREVWISGRGVGDITTDPVFRRPIQSIAQLYDLQSQPERREVMTYGGDGGLAGTRS